MKAKIIDVPSGTDSVVVLFDTGLRFKNQGVYLESTGSSFLNVRNKRTMYHTFKLDMIDKGLL